MAAYRAKNKDVINAKARDYYRDWIDAGKTPPRPRIGPFKTKAQIDHDSYIKHRVTRSEKQKRWALNNQDKVLASSRRYYAKNPEKHAAVVKSYRTRNPIKMKEWNRKKYDTVMGRIHSRMSREIARTLRGGKKLMGWQVALGYTSDDLARRLESLFTEGMTWDLFMRGYIHIDHAIPKSKFNFTSTNDIDFLRCWSLYNLQPMWAKENLSKGARILEPTQIPLGI